MFSDLFQDGDNDEDREELARQQQGTGVVHTGK